jgi:hypothetical protein
MPESDDGGLGFGNVRAIVRLSANSTQAQEKPRQSWTHPI